MSLQGFNKGFTNSKIVSRKILSDDISVGNLNIDEPGNYVNKISLKSNTPGATDPTSDSDDYGGSESESGALGAPELTGAQN